MMKTDFFFVMHINITLQICQPGISLDFIWLLSSILTTAVENCTDYAFELI